MSLAKSDFGSNATVKQICIYRGSFITRFQPGMIIALYYCFMLHHNMFVFQIVLTILYYIKHQLCSLYVYRSFVYPVSCYSLIHHVFMFYFATIRLPIYFYSTDLQATESERRIPRFPFPVGVVGGCFPVWEGYLKNVERLLATKDDQNKIYG